MNSIAGKAARGGVRALLSLAMMIIGSLVLWVGVPAGWLWIGSQVQAETDSIGNALGVMFVGVVVSVIALVWLLMRLNRWNEELRERSGLEPRGNSMLEMVLVVTAGIAVVAFGIWFFVLTGPGPSLAPSN